MDLKVLILNEHVSMNHGYLAWSDAGIDHLVTLGLFSGRYGDNPPTVESVIRGAKVAALVLSDTNLSIAPATAQQATSPAPSSPPATSTLPPIAQKSEDETRAGWQRAVTDSNRQFGFETA